MPPIADTDPGWYRAQKRLLDEVEHGVREANRAVIGQRVPELTRDSFLRLATVVARLRAEYLAAALLLGKETRGAVTGEEVSRLSTLRSAYDEARMAFEALERAVSRGYVDIADPRLARTPF
ncbi:hypothetical protein [Elioraea sp.]|uniref:hypothetical protein n=1 Tax=Elioraea sp. TaxID=2185103 RepID=UPI003F723EB0